MTVRSFLKVQSDGTIQSTVDMGGDVVFVAIARKMKEVVTCEILSVGIASRSVISISLQITMLASCFHVINKLVVSHIIGIMSICSQRSNSSSSNSSKAKSHQIIQFHGWYSK